MDWAVVATDADGGRVLLPMLSESLSIPFFVVVAALALVATAVCESGLNPVSSAFGSGGDGFTFALATTASGISSSRPRRWGDDGAGSALGISSIAAKRGCALLGGGTYGFGNSGGMGVIARSVIGGLSGSYVRSGCCGGVDNILSMISRNWATLARLMASPRRRYS